MDFSLTPEQETFRQTLRAWLKANIPREWKHQGSSEIPRVEAYQILKKWQRTLHEAGYIGLTWSKEYGGPRPAFMGEVGPAQEKAPARAPPHPTLLAVAMARATST